MVRLVNDARCRQGLVLEVDGRRAIVLDSEGSFLQIRIRNASEVNVGDLVPIAHARSRQWPTAFLSGFFAQGTIYAAASMIFLAILIGFISFMPSSLHREDSLTMPKTTQMPSAGIREEAYPDADGGANDTGAPLQAKIMPGATSATSMPSLSSGVGGSREERTFKVAKANSHSISGNTSARRSAGGQVNSVKPHDAGHAGGKDGSVAVGPDQGRHFVAATSSPGEPKAPGPAYRSSAIKSGRGDMSGDIGATGIQADLSKNVGSGHREIQPGPMGEPGEGVGAGENANTQAVEIARTGQDREGSDIMTAASNTSDGISLAARSIDGGNADRSKATSVDSPSTSRSSSTATTTPSPSPSPSVATPAALPLSSSSSSTPSPSASEPSLTPSKSLSLMANVASKQSEDGQLSVSQDTQDSGDSKDDDKKKDKEAKGDELESGNKKKN